MNSKITLTTVVALMIGGMSFAQMRDDGRPVSDAKTTDVAAKAGETIGENCGNTATHSAVYNNNNTGIMFDIEAISDVRISSLSVDLETGFSGKVYVYRKIGTHVGSENIPANWLLIDSATVTDNGAITFIPLSVDFPLNAGDIGGIYIRGENNVTVNYKNGSSIGTDLVNDGTIIVKEGQGINGTFGSIAQNRQFIGSVHYCTETIVVCDTTESIFNDINGNDGIFFDITTENNPITIKQFYADFDEFTSGEISIFHIFTRSGTFDGNEASNLGWTYLSFDTIYSPTPDSPVATSDELSLTIPANSTQGFLLYSDGVKIDYTTGVNVGDTVSSEPNITILSGKGTSDMFFGGSLYDGRNFNGVIDFCVGGNVGLEGLEEAIFTIFPNPANNSIQISSELKTIQSVTIMDQHGKVISVKRINNINDLQFDVSALPPSVYFVEVQSESGNSTQRFVKL